MASLRYSAAEKSEGTLNASHSFTVSGQDDGKQREDNRESNLGHIDNRDVDRRSIDDVSS